MPVKSYNIITWIKLKEINKACSFHRPSGASRTLQYFSLLKINLQIQAPDTHKNNFRLMASKLFGMFNFCIFLQALKKEQTSTKLVETIKYRNVDQQHPFPQR